MPVMQDQHLPVFQGTRLQFVRHFAERVFHERFLQDRFFAVCPAPQNGFAKPNLRALFIRDHFIADRLSEFAQLLEALWSPAPVDPRIALHERLSGALLFSCFHILFLLYHSLGRFLPSAASTSLSE